MTNKELIEKAAAIVKKRPNGDYTAGNVGAALLSTDGNLYIGVCIDTDSSLGFCAEHNAIGSMITAGESKIKKIVAVHNNGIEALILAPCGRCREFMRQIDINNLETEIILSEDKSLSLKELLPYYDWAKKL